MKLYTEEEVIKAIELARIIREKDSAYDSFSVEDISGCTEVCTYGWGEKHSDDEIIESLKPIELPSGLDTFKKIIEDRPTEFSQYNAHTLLFVIDLIQNGQEVPEQMELIKLIRKNK